MRADCTGHQPMVSGGGLLAAAQCKPPHAGNILLLNLARVYTTPCQHPVPDADLLALQDQLPPLMASKEAGSKHLAQIQHQQSGAQQAVADLKRDTDILINAFLKEEKRVRLRVDLLGAAMCGCSHAKYVICLCCQLRLTCCMDMSPASLDRHAASGCRPTHGCLQGDAKNALFKASWEEIQALEDEIGLMKQVGEGLNR